MWMWMFIGLNIVTEVHGYASNPFPESCISMSPQHASRGGVVYKPQTTDPPFEISYSHGKEGEPITVFLRNKTSTAFKGFMLEAREQGRVDEGLPLGNFILLQSDLTKLLQCEKFSAVVQTTNVRKYLIRANWTPPGNDLNITFRATFVQEFDIFWERVDVNVTSPLQTSTAEPSTTASTAEPSTTASTAEPSTTASTSKPSTTASTAEPSTTARTAESSTTASTSKPSTTASTAEPSTTASTSKPSTTASTAEPSITASTSKTSTTASTTASTSKPSTTASTSKPSTTASTAESSTTASTSKPSTTARTTASTSKPSTTASTSKPSTTASTTKLDTTEPQSMTTSFSTFFKILNTAGIAEMSFNSLTVIITMGLSIIFNIFTTSLFSHCVDKGLKISCSVICAALEISTLVLFSLGGFSIRVIVPLVSVTIVINFIQLVIVSLPIGPSHELKEICNLAVNICSVIHEIFIIAVMFVSCALEIDSYRKNGKEPWLLMVMAAYTVWIFFFVIWVFVFSTYSKTKLWRSNIGNSGAKCGQQRKKNKLCAAAVTVILMTGATTFIVAIVYGIFAQRKN